VTVTITSWTLQIDSDHEELNTSKWQWPWGALNTAVWQWAWRVGHFKMTVTLRIWTLQKKVTMS